MAELMNYPPNYHGDGDIPPGRWAAVYRDEREPSLPEYVCLVWESNTVGGVSVRSTPGTILSFVPASSTPAEAVKRAAWRAQRHGVTPENVYYWGVVRKE